MKTIVCDRLLLPLLLILFFVLSFYSATRESATIDEFRHLSTGVYYWQTGDLSYDNATPPLWKLAFSLPAYLSGAAPVHLARVADQFAGWAPWFTATEFMKDNAAAFTAFLTQARAINIFAACGCLVYLYRRSRSRFGSEAALYGTTFLAFSPTLLAHSHYASTDIIASLVMMVLVFQFMDISRSPSWFRLLGTSLLFALSLLCKFSAILLLPMFVFALILGAPKLGAALPWKPRNNAAGVAAFVLSLLLSSVVALAVFNAQYGFRDGGFRLTQLELRSLSLQALSVTPLGQMPLPLPKDLIEGFDRQKSDSEGAEFPSFLMGKWSEDGFWYYYAVAFCLKESVPFILMLMLVLLARNRKDKSGVVVPSESLFLWYLPICLFIVLSFMNRLNVGVRYLLPVYPFFGYFFSRFFAGYSDRKWLRWMMFILLALHCISVLRVAPRFTTYFNEFCGGPTKGYRYLIDSNIDFGQGLMDLDRHMRENKITSIQLAYFGHALPELYGIKQELLKYPPKPGYAAISVSLLQGHPYLLTYLPEPFIADYDYYGFMRTYRPITLIGNSIMLYRID